MALSEAHAVKGFMIKSLCGTAGCGEASVIVSGHGFSPVAVCYVPLRQTPITAANASSWRLYRWYLVLQNRHAPQVISGF